MKPLTAEDHYQMPPKNLQAERQSLGAAMLDANALHEVLTILQPDDFYLDEHQIIFRAIRRLQDEAQPVTSLAISESLQRTGDFKAAGGDETLSELMESVPHTLNAAYDAAIVKQKAIARRLYELAHATIDEVRSSKYSGDDLLGRMQSSLMAIDAGRTDRRLVPIADAMREAVEAIETRHKRRGELSGVGTGLVDLDRVLGGLQPEQLVILAARPSMGKTALALNICDYVAVEQGGAVLFVTLEMSETQLAERMILARSSTPGERAKNGRLDESEFLHLRCAASVLSQTSVYFDATPTQDVLQVLSTARNVAQRADVSLVVIDYIQLIDSPDGRESRQEQVAKISRRLKVLARELKVPVIALSQLNRSAEARDGHRPRMADLRESGAIEQDADVVLLLHRPEYYDPQDKPNVAEVIIAKNRNGDVRTVSLYFDKPTMKFSLLSPDIPPQEGGQPAF